MSVASDILILVGATISVLAGIGLLRFNTTYARFHAAGKASPVAFLILALGVGLEIGTEGAILLAFSSLALIITLPVGVHLLFRAFNMTAQATYLDNQPNPDEI